MEPAPTGVGGLRSSARPGWSAHPSRCHLGITPPWWMRSKVACLLVAENLLKAPDDAFMFMWWTTRDDYPWAEDGIAQQARWVRRDIRKPRSSRTRPGDRLRDHERGCAAASGHRESLSPEQPELAGPPRLVEDAARRQQAGRPAGDPRRCRFAAGTSPPGVLSGHRSQGLVAAQCRQYRQSSRLFQADPHRLLPVYDRIRSIAMFPWYEDNPAHPRRGGAAGSGSVEQYYMLPSDAMQGDEAWARASAPTRAAKVAQACRSVGPVPCWPASGRGYYGDRTEECFF